MVEIKTMDYEQIDQRKADIKGMLETEDLTLEKVIELTDEVDALEARRLEIKDTVEKREALLKEVANATDVTIIESKSEGDNKMKEERTFDINSVEYRNAFLKTLMNRELTVEERAAYTHTTANTGAVVPEALQNMIYSNMEEAHPILADVNILRTGTVIKLAKHTAIVAGDAAKKGEGVANDDEENTFVNVTLAGNKFVKHVDISYELDAMSIPAFEQYLVQEIGARLGAAIAKDIVAQIKTDALPANLYDAGTPGTVDLADVLKGLGKLKAVGQVYVYTNNTTLYNNLATIEGDAGRVSFVGNFQDGIAARLLGKGIKEEDAVEDGDILFLDPKQFTWNEVRGITFEQDRDVKKGVKTIAGHAIGEGALTNDQAAAVLTVGTAL